MNTRPAGRRRAPIRHNRRVPLAAYRLRRAVDALDRELDRHPQGREAHPLFDAALEVYADWARMAHPTPPCMGAEPAAARTVKIGAAQ